MGKLVADQCTRLLGPDLKREVERIERLHGEVHVVGSADLVQTLLVERLVDRLRLFVHPLLLGRGKRLLAGGTEPAALKRTRSHAFGNGSLLLEHEPNGEPACGTTTLDAAPGRRLGNTKTSSTTHPGFPVSTSEGPA